jgi:acetyl-CoA C-acetyltransferase
VNGPITAANMAVAADAAAFCLLVAPDHAPGRAGLARIMAASTVGAAPEDPALAALPAIAEVMARAGLTPADLVAAELMEAFAVQALVTIDRAGLRATPVNPAGGALARGHPIGASGAICAVRAVREATTRRGPVLAAIPAAGGIGSAVLFQPC